MSDNIENPTWPPKCTECGVFVSPSSLKSGINYFTETKSDGLPEPSPLYYVYYYCPKHTPPDTPRPNLKGP